VAGAVGSLSGHAGTPRLGAGVALVILACAGCLAAARAAGPVMLPAADAAWLVMSPLPRRAVLGRTARTLLVVSAVVGAALGLALTGVLGAPDELLWRLAGAIVLGIAVSVGGMALAVLAQASQAWHAFMTATLAGLVVLAVIAASGQARAALAAVANAPVSAVGTVAAVAVVPAAFLVRQAWVALGRIPARDVLAASTRAGHVASAAVSLDPGAMTWIAEDNHWRGRSLRSRPWPSLPAPLALAWQDWRRISRRPGRLVAMAATAVLPAVLAQAGAATAAGVVVLAGALAVAASGASGARRDGDNPTLARLAGVGLRPGLAARALLPALLSGAWTALALTALTVVGGLPAGAWWLLGPATAPAVAAAALRMARRAPVNHSMPVIDTPGGVIPTGPLFWAFTGPDLGLIGCLPAILALLTRPDDLAGFLAAQAVAGAAVLAAYLSSVRPK
jgi:hypothetical protein